MREMLPLSKGMVPPFSYVFSSVFRFRRSRRHSCKIGNLSHKKIFSRGTRKIFSAETAKRFRQWCDRKRGVTVRMCHFDTVRRSFSGKWETSGKNRGRKICRISLVFQRIQSGRSGSWHGLCFPYGVSSKEKKPENERNLLWEKSSESTWAPPTAAWL